MRRGLLLLVLLGFFAQLQAHTVQIAWQILQNGKVRVWLEHWHGHVHGSPSNFYITASVTYGGVTSNATYYADGFYNATPLANLPESNTIQVLAGCSGEANTYNDWIYFDFNPPACNQAVSITILNGPPVETEEACSQIFPQTVGSNFDDLAGPIISASDTCFSDQGTNLVTSFSSVQIEDACDAAPSVSYSINGNPITLPYDFPLGTTTVDVLATDNASNSSSSSFNVQVMSGISLTHLSDVYCYDGNEGSLSAPSGFNTYSWSGPNGYSSNQQQANNLSAGNYTAIVTNAAGCTFSASETISVLDSVAPSVTSGNLSVYLDENGVISINPSDVANLNDDCSVTFSSVTPSSFSCSDIGMVKVDVLARDGNGNEKLDSFNIQIIDTVKPNILIQDLQSYLDENGLLTISLDDLDLSVNDNCGVDTVYLSNTDFDCDDFGVQLVTVYAVDINGNLRSQTFNLEVLDSIGAHFAFGSIATVNSSCAVNSLVSPVLGDNCSGPLLLTNNAVFPIQNDTVVEWYLDDSHGNKDTIYQNIFIMDTINPVIECPEIQYQYISEACSVNLNDFSNIILASDNCEVVSLVQSPVPGSAYALGDTVEISFIASDDFNNNTTCSFSMVVLDSTAPILVCPEDQTIYTAEDNCSNLIGDYTQDVSVSDACQISVISQSPGVNTSISGMNYIVTMSAEDISGNNGTCTFSIDVLDTVAPILYEEVENNIIVCNLRNLESPDFIDNCGTVTNITNDIVDFEAEGPDTIIVTWTAVDNSGNQIQIEQTVYLESHVAGSIFQSGDSLITQNEGLTYEWIDCLSNETLQEGDDHVFVTVLAGEYAVIEANEYGCKAQSECYEIFGEGEDEGTGIMENESLGIQIYPNPVSDYIIVQSDVKDINAIKVFDMNGKKILQHNGSGNLDLKDLKDGIYVLHIYWNGGSAKHPFVKQ